jgi:hypothetical protein
LDAVDLAFLCVAVRFARMVYVAQDIPVSAGVKYMFGVVNEMVGDLIFFRAMCG